MTKKPWWIDHSPHSLQLSGGKSSCHEEGAGLWSSIAKCMAESLVFPWFGSSRLFSVWQKKQNSKTSPLETWPSGLTGIGSAKRVNFMKIIFKAKIVNFSSLLWNKKLEYGPLKWALNNCFTFKSNKYTGSFEFNSEDTSDLAIWRTQQFLMPGNVSNGLCSSSEISNQKSDIFRRELLNPLLGQITQPISTRKWQKYTFSCFSVT